MPTKLLLLTVAAALTAACSGRAPVNVPVSGAASGQAGAQASTDANGLTLPDFTFTPARGGGFSITLPGHGTQGYAWHLVTSFDANVVAPLNLGQDATASRIGSVPAGSDVRLVVQRGTSAKTFTLKPAPDTM